MTILKAIYTRGFILIKTVKVVLLTIQLHEQNF